MFINLLLLYNLYCINIIQVGGDWISEFLHFLNKANLLNVFPISEVTMDIMNMSPIMEIVIQKA
jgi:hypothetical protein